MDPLGLIFCLEGEELFVDEFSGGNINRLSHFCHSDPKFSTASYVGRTELVDQAVDQCAGNRDCTRSNRSGDSFDSIAAVRCWMMQGTSIRGAILLVEDYADSRQMLVNRRWKDSVRLAHQYHLR